MNIITRGFAAPAGKPIGNRVKENIYVRGCLLLHTSASKGFGKVPHKELTVFEILEGIYGTTEQ